MFAVSVRVFGLIFTIYGNNGNKNLLQGKEVKEWRCENQSETTTKKKREKVGETK